ncbi:lysyl oxidase family protein [Myxococcus sp. RHSTA-1-4]|uniref:lysyl oxidase family protein n=1 Tax=Myxococcus sp. RHSTA-1-4 TaxID=2874601 RepID=UPI001CC197BB|nr:lysyl oxidase family protein [Myxococcus sp. RHSTA-1-4]MBZ4423291.1 FG-GAP-like repeat-containing protein [Myxococcus sp. RHSTA-1-4]
MPSSHRALAAVSLLFALGACKDEDPKPLPSGPELSETPLWQVKADPSLADECFGSSVALADFNGDGRKDLAVGTEPCWSSFTVARHPGRVSFFAGEARFFSTQPVSSLMTWTNTHSRTSGQSLRTVAGDVNGDAYADLLVFGRYGASVFLGGPDLGTLLAAPVFRVPGNGLFFSTALVDFNGDGLDDLVSSRAGELSFFQATPGAEGGPFTLVHKRQGFIFVSQGDVNGDGAGDLMLPSADTENLQELYLGCKAGSPFACEGPLSAEPARTLVASSARLSPDVNGDGHREAFLVMDNGVVNFHLSEPGGAISSTAAWSLMEDPVFPGLSAPVEVGDMDGDGERHDFVMSALGRLYFYSPANGVSAELKPIWSWPRADSLSANHDVYRRASVAVPGDLDGDGFDDLVVATGASGDLLNGPVGEVSIYGGGRVPKEPKDPPYTQPVRPCDLRLDPVNGKPDLTVDASTVARTLHVVRKTFAAESCEVFEGCVAAPGERRLLRFSAALQNLGRASAIFPPLDSRPDLYVFDECHGHDHLKGFAGYELRDSRGQQVLTGRKQGFALMDITSYCTDAAPSAFYDPMGISPGWADVYTFDIPCQWVDITGLADGTYTLRVGVDESDILEEESVHPNEVFVRMSLEGDTATVLP